MSKQGDKFLQFEYDQKRADKAIRFIERCCYLSKGKGFAGKPFILRPWQKEIIGEIFGWWDPSTGLRRYRRAFLFIPRKNGKSNLAAAIALYCLLADGELGAEVVLAANTREQASIVFSAAAGMVRYSKILTPECEVIPSSKRILVESSDSKLMAVSADAGTNLGLDISGLIFDEIAVAPNSDLYDALTSASGARKDYLHVFITTAGYDTTGIGHQLYEWAKHVQQHPESDPRFYAAIFEVPQDQPWTDKKLWKEANPALGDFLNEEYLDNEFTEAINNTSSQGKFKMYHLNQWIQASESWLDVVRWDECVMTPAGVSEETFLKDKPCYIGVDLSKTTDLTAVTCLWDLGDRKYYLKPYIFLPEDDLRGRELRDHVPYSAWVEKGYLKLTPGQEVDYSFVQKKIEEIAATNSVKAIGSDPWQAKQLMADLEAAGFNVIKVRQGPESLSEATKKFESLIISKSLLHDDNACMSWQVGNVVLRLDANGNPVPDKKRSNHRFDSVQAGVIALACALKLQLVPEKKKPGVFRVTVLG